MPNNVLYWPISFLYIIMRWEFMTACRLEPDRIVLKKRTQQRELNGLEQVTHHSGCQLIAWRMKHIILLNLVGLLTSDLLKDKCEAEST